MASSALISLPATILSHAAIVSSAHSPLTSSSPSCVALLVRNCSPPAESVSLRSRPSRHLRQIVRAASEDGEPSTSGDVAKADESVPEAEGRVGGSIGARPRKRADARAADSTDWISSSLTRRFGLGAGLAWVGVLAFGVISEQVKTRNEVFREEQGTRDVEGSKEVILSNGIRYTELRNGGGTTPQRGDLVVISLTGQVASTGEVFVDTTAKGKRPVAFLFGAKPYTGGMCDGLEDVLQTTRVGGKRRVTIPAALGFGEKGTTLNSGIKIPGNAMLEYVVELQKASIAPS